MPRQGNETQWWHEETEHKVSALPRRTFDCVQNLLVISLLGLAPPAAGLPALGRLLGGPALRGPPLGGPPLSAPALGGPALGRAPPPLRGHG